MGQTLFVLPCSGKKSREPLDILPSGTIRDDLQSNTAALLARARVQLAPAAKLDEGTLMPAVQRYVGALYVAASPCLADALRSGNHLLIISGAYGLVKPLEGVGLYDAKFDLSKWPKDLLQSCLVEYCIKHSITAAYAFASRSTDYAQLIRTTHWKAARLAEAQLITPLMDGNAGALTRVPRTIGEAFCAQLADGLHDGWQSTARCTVAVEDLV